MKKSTLITTIAMIVVVVVALSTATYAWFSTSTSAVATSATISTTAAADWTLADARGDGTDYIINAASDSIDLNNTTINQGLWTPVAAISTAFDDEMVGASGSINGLQQFITAKKSKAGTIFDQEVSIRPDILKVTNSSNGEKYLKVSVILNAGNDTTRVASFYACAAIRFYMAFEINDKQGGTIDYTARNQYVCAERYGYEDSGLTTSVARSGQTTFEKATANNVPAAVTSGDNLILTNISYASAPTVYTGNETPTGFAIPAKWGITDESQLAQYGVAADEYIYMYNFELPYHFAVGDAANVLLFTWIDGWTAQAEAGGASFKVSYAFNSGIGTNV